MPMEFEKEMNRALWCRRKDNIKMDIIGIGYERW
jgi:hypothetical protein